ncbi:uncharacterized protein L203_101689 [Cryptococcus depauperatus CBS 7841]|uniref:Transmembrane protein 14C n=1 Tax=Cryptococcus depauperatus CBS 7841 TaxID=1295531 RepID=A0AAJ8JQA3_9TREE
MPPINIVDYSGYAYASLLVVGGIIGGLRKGSAISVVAGVGSGLAAAYGANRVSKNRLDAYPSLTVSALLLALMSWRFYKTGKFMPAGLVMIIVFYQSLVVVVPLDLIRIVCA